MAYHLKQKITVDNTREVKPDGYAWRKNKAQYQVRSDGGGMCTRFDDFPSLGEARKAAMARARACGWAEVFRWAENGQSIKKYVVAIYDRELSA